MLPFSTNANRCDLFTPLSGECSRLDRIHRTKLFSPHERVGLRQVPVRPVYSQGVVDDARST